MGYSPWGCNAGIEGPQLARTGASQGFPRAAAPVGVFSRGDRDIGVAFQSHPVGYASSRVEAKAKDQEARGVTILAEVLNLNIRRKEDYTQQKHKITLHVQMIH